VPTPAAYAVFDCETTGTDTGVDEIVSLAVVRLDADGIETARYARLVQPAHPIPVEATAVHGIDDADVAEAPRFAEIADEVLGLLEGAVFVAHNVGFDLAMLQEAFARAGIDYRPDAVACTLEAFRLLEPLADNHRLQSICERRGIALQGAHEALSDVLATVALLRVLLEEGIAPETVELDHVAYMRLRSRGDTRPASEPQIRRVFGLARSADLVLPDGGVDRDRVVALVERVACTADVDALTRAQVQDVYDALDQLIEQRAALAPAAHAS
jgi:DNA polymerase III epsilon subunit family exonuclease